MKAINIVKNIKLHYFSPVNLQALHQHAIPRGLYQVNKARSHAERRAPS